jgi:ribosomal-protein-alanine N-acetyltransferase
MPRPPSITLRPFHEADTTFFTGMASDERVTRFIGDGQPWDEQTIHDRIRAALQEDPLDQVGASRWFLATEANAPVGIVVSSCKDAGVEVGYWVSPDHWGRGIAGAMLDATLASIPDTYGSRNLLARVDPANAVSAKLLTRRGFQLDTHVEGLDHYTLVK